MLLCAGYNTVSPAPAGCAMIRDIRAWQCAQSPFPPFTPPFLPRSSGLSALLARAFSRVGRSGGTPNLSNAVRAIPQSQFVPHWYRLRFVRSLPRTIYNTLSEHGQRICREIVAAETALPDPPRYFSFPAPEEGDEGAAAGLPSVRLGAGSKLRAPKL